MKKHLLSLFVFLTCIGSAFATHNRAGEITYRHISGYTYEITVTTYTNIAPSIVADRCELDVYFGDGDSALVSRINGPPITGTSPCPNGGEPVIGVVFTKVNIYKVLHTYSGPGNYIISMEDENRNDGICNILGGNSVNTSFFIRTELKINPFLTPNSSPILLNLPLDEACVGECFEHNPGAYDADGDSLYYTLTTCYANGAPIPGYSLPPNMTTESIDHFTGDLVWCSPPLICQYNIAILIEEWKLFGGVRYLVGTVLRDMQIDVVACSNNGPQINPVRDTCVTAGTNLNFNVTATDPNPNTLTLTANGGPFVLTPSATFSSSPAVSFVSGTFNWTPSCDQVQLLPYLVTFKVTDNHPSTPLVNFESMFIRVIAPAITGLTATPSGASMVLNWLAPLCADTIGSHRLKKYLIYRKNTCDPWIHSECETGVPAYTGYTLIGSTSFGVTTFTDNNGGLGLTHGLDYSYIVVAEYIDGSQSYASSNVCAQLVRDVPIITNVSVTSTDAANGSIWTHWVKPIGNSGNLDTLINPPPYEYRLMQAQGMTGPLTFTQVAAYVYPSFSALSDTGFVSTSLNTQDFAYTYRVDFYSNGLLKGSTHTASSVYLTTAPTDNKIVLSWQEMVPWTNYRYDVYKETSAGSTVFAFLDSTTGQTYTDTGLVNGVLYCYKIVSVGSYSDTALPAPLYNSSQIKCDRPVDTTPPCQPNFVVNNDCGINTNVLSWTNPNSYCSDDAIQYNIYFSPTPESELLLIHSTTDMSETSYSHNYLFEGVPSIAGCYAVTAVDSFANESPVVTIICVDNCPEYELPNVFTPNGDNNNEFFTPLPGYRYVKDVDIKIYDRWGLLMFETSDPNVMWDGTNKDSGMMCSNGTYFYVCIVNEIRLQGIIPRTLKGFVQLIKENGGTSK
ncbi:MAG: gliding motility-associated C-terminal domain-containing protein [Bacteroidota bacterium]|nr:gliding motility-associated C-terminal domain-containing protein [Bacteroidota bacterium]